MRRIGALEAGGTKMVLAVGVICSLIAGNSKFNVGEKSLFWLIVPIPLSGSYMAAYQR